jgi:hypothetical protein
LLLFRSGLPYCTKKNERENQNMKEFWEEKFKTEGAMWDFFPSYSAIRTLEIFKSNRLNHILIPGFGYGRNQ